MKALLRKIDMHEAIRYASLTLSVLFLVLMIITASGWWVFPALACFFFGTTE